MGGSFQTFMTVYTLDGLKFHTKSHLYEKSNFKSMSQMDSLTGISVQSSIVFMTIHGIVFGWDKMEGLI